MLIPEAREELLSQLSRAAAYHHTCLPCLPNRCASPGIPFPIMIGLMVVLLTFKLTSGENLMTL